MVEAAKRVVFDRVKVSKLEEYLHYCNYNSGSERGRGGSTIVGKNFITVSVVG